MNAYGWVTLVSLGGWLLLAVSAYASYQLNWKQSVRMVLIWAGIFTAVVLLFSLVMG